MEYGHRYGGTSFELFARISEKNHAHSTLNPLAAYSKAMSLEEIMGDVMIAYPNTRPMCSANCDGAAAAVVVSDSVLKTLSLEQQRRAIKVSASVLTTDPWQAAPDPPRRQHPDPTPPARPTSRRASGRTTLDLVELHDCFATAELVHYDNLMLCEEGGGRLLRLHGDLAGRLDPGQRLGGLESKGHPIATTGIATSGRSATISAGRPATARSSDRRPGPT
jgi:acetyl-CoA acetyltransferase